MTRRVGYSPHVREQLTDLYTWIANESGFPDRAEEYVTSILDYCENLAIFPFVGTARDDLRPGLRTLGFRKRVVIAFAVTQESVDVLGIYSGGRDSEDLLAAGEA